MLRCFPLIPACRSYTHRGTTCIAPAPCTCTRPHADSPAVPVRIRYSNSPAQLYYAAWMCASDPISMVNAIHVNREEAQSPPDTVRTQTLCHERMFQQKKTLKDEVRDAQKTNRKGVREIETELRKLDREETKLISDMKQAAKTNPATAKVLAKQLVRLRQNRQRMQGSAAQITGINAGLKTQQIMHTSMTAVAASAEAMGKVSTAMDPAKVAHTAQEFAKQNARMEMAGGLMDDAMEDMFEVGEDEADDLVNQVLDEVGIDAVSGAVSAPKHRVAGKQAAPAAAAADSGAKDAELEAMLAQLRS
eukprot:jgi/Ulvmu1/3639/UM017_0052.1